MVCPYKDSLTFTGIFMIGPEVTAAIVGTRHIFQIDETAIAGRCTLSEEDIASIERLLKK